MAPKDFDPELRQAARQLPKNLDINKRTMGDWHEVMPAYVICCF